MTIGNIPALTAQDFYDATYANYIAEGMSPSEANEKSDLDLIEWTKPLDLPEGDFEDLWS